MLAEIMTGLQSLKTASDIVRGLNAAITQATINDVKLSLQESIINAQSALMAAQTEQAASLQRIDDLEKEIMRIKEWEVHKKRYELKELKLGVLAYGLKDGVQPPEPDHYVCQTCYEKSKKSVLQLEVRAPGMASVYVCHQCGSELYAAGFWTAEHSRHPKRL